MKNPFRRRPEPLPLGMSQEQWAILVDHIVIQAERITREAVTSLPVRTPTVPVVPGDIPNGARVMIRYWAGSDSGLVECLCGAYDLNEPTALLWIRIGRRGF